MAPRWATTHRPPVHHQHELSTAHAGGSTVVYAGLPEDLSPPGCTSAAVRDGRGGSDHAGRAGGEAAHSGARLPPFDHDGTERRIGHPQDPTEQTRCYRGKTTCHTVKNVLLINAALTILFLS